MKAYSHDIRERIVRSWQQGQTKAVIAKVFMVSLSSVKRYIQQFVSEGHVRAKVQRRQAGKLTPYWRKRLARQVDAHPDFTLAQHKAQWNEHYRLLVSESCLSRALRFMGITRKKKTLGAIERDETVRANFRAVMAKLDSQDVVVVDESGTRIGMTPVYARSARGSRVYDHTIRNYGHNVTLIASMTIHGMQAAMTIDGPLDQPTFERFVRQVLCPTLQTGQLVILDNLACHKSKTVEQLINEAGCQLLFLPAYSPDLSPIEEAFSKLKTFIRQCRCQTVPDLLLAIKRGLNAISAADAFAWFTHAGFA